MTQGPINSTQPQQVLRVTALNASPGDHQKFGQENLKGAAIFFAASFLRCL